MSLRDLAYHLLHALGLTYVDRDPARLPPRGTNLLGGGIHAFLLAARQHHMRPQPGERVGDASADPAATAGDEGNLALKQAGTEHAGGGGRLRYRRWGGGGGHGIGSGSKTSCSASASDAASLSGATVSASESCITGEKERR